MTLTETKNGSVRTVPLSNAAVGVLRIALANPVRPIATDLVLFGEPGRDQVRRPYKFRPQWNRTLASLGIKGPRFHDLRHEAVSKLVEAGLGDHEVATISWPKSMQMLRRYSLCTPSDARTRALKACGRKIGRRVNYPAIEVARIICNVREE